MRIVWLLYLFFFVPPSFAQDPLIPVEGLPTKELYDLHVDTKGYLWIAHGLGISRYDGLNFINYTHPLQINLRMTDIVEDKAGRIWCHNFSGQLFYIENGRMHFLEAYDYKQENQTPRMAICGNELLVTSYKGLFVLNTITFKTHFFPFQQTVPTESVSLAVIRNKALLFNHLNWYVYEKEKLKKISAQTAFPLPRENFLQLQPATLQDTAFLTANPSGILYKVMLKNDDLTVVGKEAYNDFINGISIDKEALVHTRNNSYNLAKATKIKNYDLTDVVTGKEGNTWYSSRREGLLVSYQPSLWEKTMFNIDPNDYIRSLNANAGYFFAGTQRGTLYRFPTDSSRAEWKQELFNGLGSIDFIRLIRNNQFIVGSSTNTYVVDAGEKQITDSLPIKSIFDVGIDSSSFYLATPVGIYVMPNLKHTEDKGKWLQIKEQQYPFYNWRATNANTYLLFPQRTRSIRFDSLRQHVYAATKNGLFEVDKKGIHPYYIQGKEVHATGVAYRNGSLYIGTVNDGLWIVENGNVQHFTTANYLTSNTIIRVKLTEDHLWLFEKEGMQVLDIHTKGLLQHIDLPRIEGSNVQDVTEKGNYAYLATAKGVYRIPLHLNAVKMRPHGYLDYVIANAKDTLWEKNSSLSHQQNDVQFFFSAPSFSDRKGVSFRYRLKGAEEEWRLTEPGERMIRYSSLPPGNYQFELFAVSTNGMEQEEVITYDFDIAKPWWRMWWAILLLNTALVAVIYLIIQNRINQKLRLELMRRSISHDLHDDIGATLSSLNFYIDLAQSEKQNGEYLQRIKENVNNVIGSLDDLVWSINPKNDTTEQFVQRMKDHAVPLLKAAGIQCHFRYEPKLLQLKLDLLTKRHLYLLFKEMVNNVVKHSRSRNCYISLTCEHSKLHLAVTDDGLGFHPGQDKQNRNGLSTMRERAQKLNGKITISSTVQKGSQVEVTIPV